MKRILLALFAVTLSLPAVAAVKFGRDVVEPEQSTTVKGSKSNSDNASERPAIKGSKSNTSDRASGADACKFTIDEAGVKRQATEQQQKICKGGKGKMPAYDRNGIGTGGDEGNNSGFSKPNNK
jgi:hypothetical protein